MPDYVWIFVAVALVMAALVLAFLLAPSVSRGEPTVLKLEAPSRDRELNEMLEKEMSNQIYRALREAAAQSHFEVELYRQPWPEGHLIRVQPATSDPRPMLRILIKGSAKEEELIEWHFVGGEAQFCRAEEADAVIAEGIRFMLTWIS